MKKGKLLQITAGFFALMICFTVLSRAADQKSIAVVRTERPQNKMIEHAVRASGEVVQNQELAVTTQPDQRVTAIYVREGQRVAKGDLLFEIDQTLLEEKILNQQQEMEKQQLQIGDLKSQKEVSAQQRASSQAQAQEQYSLSTGRAGVQVSRAKKQLEQAQQKLKEFQKNSGQKQEDSEVGEALERTLEEKTNAYIAAQQELRTLEWEIENAVYTAKQNAASGVSLVKETVPFTGEAYLGNTDDSGGAAEILPESGASGLAGELENGALELSGSPESNANMYRQGDDLQAGPSLGIDSIVDVTGESRDPGAGMTEGPVNTGGISGEGADFAENGSPAGSGDIVGDIYPAGSGNSAWSSDSGENGSPAGDIYPTESGNSAWSSDSGENGSPAGDVYSAESSNSAWSSDSGENGSPAGDVYSAENDNPVGDPDSGNIDGDTQTNGGDDIISEDLLPQTESRTVTPEELERAEKAVRDSYSQELAAARKKVEDAEEEKAAAEAALLEYQQEQLASVDAQNTETAQQLLAEVQAAQQAYEDAAIAANEAAVTGGRAIQMAGIADASNSSDRVSEITYEQMELSLKKLEDLKAAKGKIYAATDGLITRINIMTGEKTGDTTAVLMADLSKGCRFTAEITEEQQKYIGTGDLVRLTSGNGKQKLEDLPVDSIMEDEENEGVYHVAVQLPEESFEIGTNVTLEFSRKSEAYPVTVPLSALHLDAQQQPYVLVTEEAESVMGQETRARRVNVTVLEKNESYAALAQGSLDTQQEIIVGSDKAVDNGSRVRVET